MLLGAHGSCDEDEEGAALWLAKAADLPKPSDPAHDLHPLGLAHAQFSLGVPEINNPTSSLPKYDKLFHGRFLVLSQQYQNTIMAAHARNQRDRFF
jgi:hypothetical protein